MTELRTVRHGPFMGYVSSLAKDLIPDNAAGPDSRDYRYNPTLGKFIERDGTTTLNSSLLSALTSPTGLRTRELFEFPAILDQAGSQQFSNGYPTYAALYDRESSPTASRDGFLYFRSSNSGGSDQYPGKSWSATTYPLSGAKSFIKALPCWTQANITSSGKFSTRLGAGIAAQQQYVYGGGRNVLISGKWMYTVGEYVESRRWNMLFNDSSSNPTRKERHWPMGILPPLFPAWIKTADFPSTPLATDTWNDGDRFWISACYKFEDGTFGPPFIPSASYGAAVTGGYNDNYGLVTLSSGTPDRTWSYVPWANIAQPPPGCTHTVLLRSTKVNINKFPDTVPPLTTEEGDLNFGIVALIPAGVTSYKDYGGNDVGLLFDPERVRSDHISPVRARYIGAFDGRACLGYTLPSPQLIYVAHTGSTNPNDNTDDDDATLGSTQYFIRTDSGNLYLRKASAAFPSAPTTETISFSTKTLQEVVAAINATTVSGTTGEWRAQLAPGVDGSLPAGSVIRNTSNASSLNTYGDDGLVNDGTFGNMRSFAQGYPAVLQYDANYLVVRLRATVDSEGFYFTRSAPQSAAVGVTSAPNFWVAGNYRKPPEYSGILMGFAPFDNGMAVFYSEKVWLFRNTVSNRSGRDEDYYFALLSDDGCIAWDSIVRFNNAVGWLSRKGYKISAGVPGDERVITGAIFDPTEQTGDLAYEIGQCLVSAAADTDDMRFHAFRAGHVLKIKYRSSSSASVPDFEQEYDFSEGAQSGGLSELLRPDGSPFGWSPPFRRPGETMGEFRNASGVNLIQAVEPGRIDHIDTGYTDNGTQIDTVLYTKMDDQGELRRRKRERRFSMKFRSPVGHTMVVTHSRDRLRLSATTYTMQNTPHEVVTEIKRIKLAGQAPGRVSEYAISGTRVSEAAEIWMIERELKLLDTPLDGAG